MLGRLLGMFVVCWRDRLQGGGGREPTSITNLSFSFQGFGGGGGRLFPFLFVLDGCLLFPSKFSEDQCISTIPSKRIVEPAAGVLDSCIVRWTDGCRYEIKVLEIAQDYATAEMYERQHLEEQSPAPTMKQL